MKQHSPPLPLFTLLEGPYGMSTGVVTVVAMYLLRNAGQSIGQATSINSIAIIPLTFSFLLAPLTDFFVRRRTWVFLSTVFAGLLSATAVLLSAPSSVHLIAILLFATIVCRLPQRCGRRWHYGCAPQPH